MNPVLVRAAFGAFAALAIAFWMLPYFGWMPIPLDAVNVLLIALSGVVAAFWRVFWCVTRDMFGPDGSSSGR